MTEPEMEALAEKFTFEHSRHDAQDEEYYSFKAHVLATLQRVAAAATKAERERVLKFVRSERMQYDEDGDCDSALAEVEFFLTEDAS